MPSLTVSLGKMLIFAGLGIEQSPSLKAVETLRGCDHIFFEDYTSPRIKGEDALEVISSTIGKKIEKLEREDLEVGIRIIELAKGKKVAILSSGDPMIATTHQELRTRAIKEGIETKIIHGSSILTAVAGEFGLHSYNFGRSVTITTGPLQHTAYNTVYLNLLRGLHTVILLEWRSETDFFLPISAAVQALISSERDLRYGIISDTTLLLIGSRIGSDGSRLSAEKFKDASQFDPGLPPHVLVIPGSLHFTETDALCALTGRSADYFTDNSLQIQKLSQRMVLSYSSKTLEALDRAKKAAKDLKRVKDVFENVECYTKDALRFLNEGRDELAVLSIGYAEGLLDSLRFCGLLEFEW